MEGQVVYFLSAVFVPKTLLSCFRCMFQHMHLRALSANHGLCCRCTQNVWPQEAPCLFNHVQDHLKA